MRSIFQRIKAYYTVPNGIWLILYCVLISIPHFYLSYYEKGFINVNVEFLFVAVILAPFVLRTLGKLRLPVQKTEQKRLSTILWSSIFFFIPFIMLFFMYLVYYPGAFSPDSINQYQQALTNSYNDWHPVLHTLIAFKIPLFLTGGWIGSIVLFQIIAFCGVLSYALTSLRRFAGLPFAVVTLCYFLLHPQIRNILMYPWKDCAFAIGALLLVAFALQIFFSDGEWLRSVPHCIVWLVATVSTTIMRHNGILFTLPMCIAVLFCCPKLWKRICILCGAVLALTLFIRIPLYSLLSVQSPNHRVGETFGLPMTVISETVASCPDALPDETLDFAYSLVPKEVWENKYVSGSYNSVKFLNEFDSTPVEQAGPIGILKTVFSCFRSAPGTALYGLLKLTEPVYSVEGELYRYESPVLTENSYGIVQSGNARLQWLNNLLTSVEVHSLPHLFVHLGVMHLLLIVAVFAKCRLNRYPDWKKILLVLPLFCYNYGTMLLLSGSGDCSRFFFYTYLLVPFLLAVLYRQTNDNEIVKELS